ncbi:hypothetical protein ASC97_30330 [Rhizobium sp. Root1203]|uniref:hypothetical protein n=1 Tax=Rhizobium sp. Root1203 TaxID=1736427 RepID=UPI00070EE6CA|nr:hypothetical protein [Rhizobium sp. Root1203]KQV17465.1 hypothetical protein ASC97_30330 [Rhizobium sp. Root1203]
MRPTSKLLLLSAALISLAARADAENLVIWTPVKVSENSYKATMGFRLPAEWETSAGADLGLASTHGGALQAESQQASLWGKISKVSVTPATRAEQAASVRVDTLRGSGSLLLSRSRSWILSDSLDLQSTRFVSLNYEALETRQASVDGSQALKLIHPWTGTSISAAATLSGLAGLTGSVAVNQTILPDLDLSATVANPGSSTQTGSIRLNYQVTW